MPRPRCPVPESRPGVVRLPALFAVQTAHALQYLIFPWRVEVNRTRRETPGGAAGELVWLHMATYLVVLLAASVLAAIALPAGAMAVVTSWLGTRPGEYTGFAILTFFNIHHHFTDGVLWKLRNPAVREDPRSPGCCIAGPGDLVGLGSAPAITALTPTTGAVSVGPHIASGVVFREGGIGPAGGSRTLSPSSGYQPLK